jgi:hypothetical protein
MSPVMPRAPNESGPSGAVISGGDRGDDQSTSLTIARPGDEPRLFDPDRYSPTSVEVLLRLPESNARNFVVASALGRIMRKDGTWEPLRNGKDAAGSLITKRRRGIVLEALKISAVRWRHLCLDWERRYVAHRCAPGVVFLFAHSLYDECPACRAELLVDHMPPSAHRDRGPGFESGRDATTEAVVLRPPGGTRATTRPTLARPPLGTNAPHHKTGSLLRDEVGIGGLFSSWIFVLSALSTLGAMSNERDR